MSAICTLVCIIIHIFLFVLLAFFTLKAFIYLFIRNARSRRKRIPILIIFPLLKSKFNFVFFIPAELVKKTTGNTYRIYHSSIPSVLRYFSWSSNKIKLNFPSIDIMYVPELMSTKIKKYTIR